MVEIFMIEIYLFVVYLLGSQNLSGEYWYKGWECLTIRLRVKEREEDTLMDRQSDLWRHNPAEVRWAPIRTTGRSCSVWELKSTRADKNGHLRVAPWPGEEPSRVRWVPQGGVSESKRCPYPGQSGMEYLGLIRVRVASTRRGGLVWLL